MTPLQIKMLLHYYAVASPYAENEPAHAMSPAVHDQRKWLVSNDMLEERPTLMSGYCLTPRGEAFIKYIIDLPLPLRTWVMLP